MKVVASLKSHKKRGDYYLVRRNGVVYLIGKKNPRCKVRQGKRKKK